LVEIAQARDKIFYASRLDPEHPWVQDHLPRIVMSGYWGALVAAGHEGRRPVLTQSGHLPPWGGRDVIELSLSGYLSS
jgi:hypothetical protein